LTAEGFSDYFGSGAIRSPRITVQDVVDWASLQIETCKSTHKLCASSRAAIKILPTRVLDLSTIQTSEVARATIRLLETGGSEGQYMALSHCWGGDVSFKTTRSSLAQMKSGFSVNELPQTFQEAIAITRGLGVNYLWIDALCIIQDDNHDWEIEAANMASVYSGSFLTLAATRANNGAEGILDLRYNIRSDGSMQPFEHYQIDMQNAPYTVIAQRSLSEAHSHISRGSSERGGDISCKIASPLVSCVLSPRFFSIIDKA